MHAVSAICLWATVLVYNKDDAASDQRTSDQGQLGGLQKKKKTAPPEISMQDIIAYLVFHRDVTNEEFRRLADQLKPCGVPGFVYGRREHMRQLEEKGVQGTWDQARVLAWSKCTYGSQGQALSNSTGMSLFRTLLCRSMLFACTCQMSCSALNEVRYM